MRVLLANPPTKVGAGPGSERYFVKAGSRWPHSILKRAGGPLGYVPFPFSMAYAAAVLREEGRDVQVLDGVAADLSGEQFLREAAGLCPDFVLLEVAAPTLEEDLGLAASLKKALPRARITAAGPHATALAEEILTRCPAVDLIFKHEYELALPRVLCRLESGVSLEGLPGLLRREGKSLVDSGPGELIEPLDRLPEPARDLFPMSGRPAPEAYRDGFCQLRPAFQMTASRGCPRGCGFCLWPRAAYAETRHRTFSPERVVREMEGLVRVRGAREIYFDDDDFAFDPGFVRDLCGLLGERRLRVRWSCMCSAAGLDEPLLGLMAEAGCIGLKFGVESASARVLEGVAKPVDLERVGRLARACAGLGIKTHAAFMLGLPGEGPDDVRRSLDYARGLEVDSIQVSLAAPLPGTPLHEASVPRGDGRAVPLLLDGRRGGARRRFLRLWLLAKLLSPGWVLRQLRYAARGASCEGLRERIRRTASSMSGELGFPAEGVIAAVHDPLDPMVGGGALRTLRAAQEFRRRGLDVTLFGPSRSKEIDGIPVRDLPDPRRLRPRLLGALWFGAVLAAKALPAMFGARILFAHNSIAAAGLGALNLVFRKRLVLDLTDIHSEYLWCPGTGLLERLLRPLVRRLEYAVIRSVADEVIVVSEAMRRLLAAEGVEPGRMTVVYDGADPAQTAPAGAGPREGILHLGTIDRQHGVDVLLRAAEKVLRRRPGVRFYFVGDGRERPAMEALAERLGIRERCVFTGYLPHAEAKAYLASAALGVIPRPDITANNVVTTLKLLEYWAHGVPVVSSRLEAIQEVGNGTVLYFRPGDPEDLAAKLDELIGDPERGRAMADDGLSKMAEFHWGKLAAKIADRALG